MKRFHNYSLPLFLGLSLAACSSGSTKDLNGQDSRSPLGDGDGDGDGTGGNSGDTSANGDGDGDGDGGSVSNQNFDSSMALVNSLSLGWNLGNSLDAPEGETAWGNPVVTPQLLQAVKNAGFDLVRIPVTWSLHTGPGPDYLIDEEWFERVEEVVGYALDAGMFALINVHHDGADNYEGVEWLTLNDAQGAISSANNSAVEARFVKIWTQIAARFKDASPALLFESMNEIHDGYDAPDPQYYQIINNLNQKFVDIVRASGGGNTNRHLVVPGYNTNLAYTLAGFEKPSDSTADHLILSVHYYDPYTYALDAQTQTWGAASPNSDTWAQEDYVRSELDKLKTTFVDAGLPVILGEYGAVHQAGYEDYRRYYMEYVTKAAKDRGIVPVYWDNGSQESGKEAFGLFNRTTGSLLHPNISEAMFRAATSDYSFSDIALPQ